ncbi:MAG: hypothetical protein PVJ51_09670 [Acidobacteriota bacterium]
MKTKTMIRMLVALVVLALAVPAWAQATIEGTWTTRARENDEGRRWAQVSLELDDEHGTWGWSVDPDDLQGISYEQLDGDVTDAHFEMVRDAGTVVFDGTIRSGRGVGTFAFTPNAQWQRDMERLGFDGLSQREAFSAAIHDITTAYVSDLRGLGYDDLDVDELFSFAIHGISTDFIRGMNDLGYADIPAKKLVSMRIHGVTVDWVRQVRAAMGG